MSDAYVNEVNENNKKLLDMLCVCVCVRVATVLPFDWYLCFEWVFRVMRYDFFLYVNKYNAPATNEYKS